MVVLRMFSSRAHRSKTGALVFPDGMRYHVLVLPERETMTPALLRKVQQLVADGATVIGPPPLKSPGLSGYPACDTEVVALAKELWGDCDGKNTTEHSYGNGPGDMGADTH